MVKTLSSRNETPITELVRDLVLILFDQMAIQDEPASDPVELWNQLEDGVVAIAESHETAMAVLESSAQDLSRAIEHINRLSQDLSLASVLLQELHAMPGQANVDCLNHATDTMKHVGQLNMTTHGSHTWAFTDAELRSTVARAIHEYNNAIISRMLSNRSP